jgi:hypothetical protein
MRITVFLSYEVFGVLGELHTVSGSMKGIFMSINKERQNFRNFKKVGYFCVSSGFLIEAILPSGDIRQCLKTCMFVTLWGRPDMVLNLPHHDLTPNVDSAEDDLDFSFVSSYHT